MSRLHFEPTLRPGFVAARVGEAVAILQFHIVNKRFVYGFDTEQPPAIVEATLLKRNDKALARIYAKQVRS